jgi:hypothetical protein
VGGAIVSMIEKVCMPLIRGQDVKSVMTSNGLKRSHDDFVLQLTGVEKIVLTPPTAANPTVCSMQVSYEAGGTKSIVDVLTAWAASQDPPVPVLGSAYSNTPGVTGWSWALDTGQIQEGLVFNAQRTTDGKAIGRGYDVGTVLFSRRGP